MASRFGIPVKIFWLAVALVGGKFFVLPSAAQSNSPAAYTWTTFAGTAGMGQADSVGENAQFNLPAAVAVDTNGNVFVADTDNDVIRKITAAGRVTTIAGFPGVFGSADGLNSAARFYKPVGITADAAGNLYVADNFNNEIRKVTPLGTNWVVSTVAGLPQFDADGDPVGGGC